MIFTLLSFRWLQIFSDFDCFEFSGFSDCVEIRAKLLKIYFAGNPLALCVLWYKQRGTLVMVISFTCKLTSTQYKQSVDEVFSKWLNGYFVSICNISPDFKSYYRWLEWILDSACKMYFAYCVVFVLIVIICCCVRKSYNIWWYMVFHMHCRTLAIDDQERHKSVWSSRSCSDDGCCGRMCALSQR